MTPAEIRQALEMARTDSIEMLEALRDEMAPGGMTYDAEKLPDAEFVGWFMDLAERPGPSPFSILDYLPQVSPKLFESLRTRYERIVAKGGR